MLSGYDLREENIESRSSDDLEYLEPKGKALNDRSIPFFTDAGKPRERKLKPEDFKVSHGSLSQISIGGETQGYFSIASAESLNSEEGSPLSGGRLQVCRRKSDGKVIMPKLSMRTRLLFRLFFIRFQTE